MPSSTLYRALLRCYPAAFREEYGAEMLRAFSDQLRHATPSVAASLWLSALTDALLLAPREHLRVLRQDLRYALRSFLSNPGFTLVAVASLALGIGANAAIFSLINSVLLRPLPVPAPHQFVILSNPGNAGGLIGAQLNESRSLLTWTEFEQLRDHATVFSGLFASQSELSRLDARIGHTAPERIEARLVSAEYFRVLGVPMHLGRGFAPAENTIGSAPYVVLSHAFWQRRFAGRTDVLGSSLTLPGGVFTVIGVTPAGFFGETVGRRPDAWFPLSMQAAVLPGRDWLHEPPGSLEKAMWLHVFGRLRPGVSLEQAQAASNVVFRQGLAAFYGTAAGSTNQLRAQYMNQFLHLSPAATGASPLRRRFTQPLLMLQVAAVLVLLIACANLSNLLLARATARRREISVRLALGASRAQLVRQHLTETLCLSLLSGLAGLALASLIRAGLLRFVSATFELPAAVDLRVFAFVFGLTLFAGLLIGLFPTLRSTGSSALAALGEQGRGLVGSGAWLRAGRFIVVGQLALSVPLLVASGLLLRSLSNLRQADLGYPRQRLLLVSASASPAYSDSFRLELFADLHRRVQSTPGVLRASYSAHGLFLGGDSWDRVEVEGHSSPADRDRNAAYEHVGPEYFSTLGVPILTGRPISAQDQSSANRVCVINQAFARHYFAGRNPIGLHLTRVFGSRRDTFEIVGLAADFYGDALREKVAPRFFLPFARGVFASDSVAFEIRTAADPAAAIAALRRTLLDRDPTLRIDVARPLTSLLDEQLDQDLLLARLSLVFGAVALLLAALGLYGVLSYAVSLRTNEIGIRKALGAQYASVVGSILGETGRLLLVGLAAGAAAAFFATRLLENRLYGLAPSDPLTFTTSLCLLAAVALVAAWIPAHRAASINPIEALRQE
jgi:predicted permease